MTESVTSRLKHHAKTDVSLIPRGLTKNLQLTNISWNKAFKAGYRDLYNWIATAEKSYTPAGNMRAPDKLVCLQWVKAWKSVTTDVKVKSFRTCGITVNVDGSEDNETHCLKAREAAHVAASLISDATSKMLDPAGEAESDDEDLFADIDSEDDEKLEILVGDCYIFIQC